jgi:hypothetical protein
MCNKCIQTRQHRLGVFIFRTVAAAFTLACMAPAVPAQQSPPTSEIVHRMDRILRPERSFVVTTTTTTFKNRAVAASAQMRAFIRRQQDGSLDTLAIILDPEPERGKVYLRKTGGDLWFFDPKSQHPVRISARQRLDGQASVDDLLSLNLQRDYSATMEGQETISDATAQARICHKLHFKAANNNAPYPGMTCWVEADSRCPVKTICFSAGGKALKTIYYDKFRGFLGESRPTEILIVDDLQPNLVTQVRFTNFDHRDLSEDKFSEKFMPDAVRVLKP